MTTLLLAFASVTQTFDLPQGLLSSICFVESSHTPNAIHIDDNGSDSLGVCQIKHETAKWLGFNGTAKQLREDTFINTYYAGKYLKYHLTRYKNNVPKAVAAYNAGSCRFNLDRSIKNSKYVKRVFVAWNEGR